MMMTLGCQVKRFAAYKRKKCIEDHVRKMKWFVIVGLVALLACLSEVESKVSSDFLCVWKVSFVLIPVFTKVKQNFESSKGL